MSTLSRIKKLTGDSLIYGLGNIIIKLLSVFLIPIYTKLFSPADYGLISITNTTFALISIFLIMGMDNAMAIFFYDDDIDAQPKSLITRICFSLALSSVALIILAILNKPLTIWLLDSPAYRNIFILSSINILFSVLPNIYIGWLRLNKRPITTMIYIVALTLLNISISLLLVVYYKVGLIGIFISQLVCAIIQTIWALLGIYNLLKIKYFSLDLLKRMVWFAAPSVPAALAIWVVTSAGSYAIDYFHSKAEVGIFQIATSLASAMLLFVGAFQMAWGPFAFSIKKEENAYHFYNIIFLLYLFVGGFLSVNLSALSSWLLVTFTTTEYIKGYVSLSLLAVSYILNGTSYIGVLGLSFAKKNAPTAVGNIVAAAFTIGLFFTLVPILSDVGASIAILCGQLILNFYLFYKSNIIHPIPFSYIRGIILFSSTLTLVLLSLLVLRSHLMHPCLLLAVVNLSYLSISFLVLNNKLFKNLCTVN